MTNEVFLEVIRCVKDGMDYEDIAKQVDVHEEVDDLKSLVNAIRGENVSSVRVKREDVPLSEQIEIKCFVSLYCQQRTGNQRTEFFLSRKRFKESKKKTWGRRVSFSAWHDMGWVKFIGTVPNDENSEDKKTCEGRWFYLTFIEGEDQEAWIDNTYFLRCYSSEKLAIQLRRTLSEEVLNIMCDEAAELKVQYDPLEDEIGEVNDLLENHSFYRVACKARGAIRCLHREISAGEGTVKKLNKNALKATKSFLNTEDSWEQRMDISVWIKTQVESVYGLSLDVVNQPMTLERLIYEIDKAKEKIQ